MSTRILIVEDNRTERALLQHVLRDEPYQIDCCSCVCEAVRCWLAARDQNKPYHLIILDIHLGDISGISFAQFIRCACDDVKIVFLSSDVSDINREWARIIGAPLWEKHGQFQEVPLLIEGVLLTDTMVLSGVKEVIACVHQDFGEAT